jgi:hypothetical protein
LVVFRDSIAVRQLGVEDSDESWQRSIESIFSAGPHRVQLTLSGTVVGGTADESMKA